MTTSSSRETSNSATNDLIKKKKMPKLWSCVFPKTEGDDAADDDKRRTKKNKEIDAKLKKDGKVYKATYRLLLLGQCFAFDLLLLTFVHRCRWIGQINSGETNENSTQSIYYTVSFPLQRHPHFHRFSSFTREKLDKIPDIKRNIRDSLTVRSNGIQLSLWCSFICSLEYSTGDADDHASCSVGSSRKSSSRHVHLNYHTKARLRLPTWLLRACGRSLERHGRSSLFRKIQRVSTDRLR